jgi:hypothetical protein
MNKAVIGGALILFADQNSLAPHEKLARDGVLYTYNLPYKISHRKGPKIGAKPPLRGKGVSPLTLSAISRKFIGATQ